ncbi:NUDIX domain-containing protein [Candidatus Dependentiae bacterium]|nr:NUDIX domain-containing protein [Candidatus Dependentiae bacterium]
MNKFINNSPYLFTNHIRFVIKTVVWHPDQSFNKFLVLRRESNDPIRPNTLDLAGGGIHWAELHQIGLQREIFEETGLTVRSIKELILFTAYHPKDEIYDFILGSSAVAIHDQVVLSKEHQEYAWITKEDFFSLYPDYTFVDHRIFNIHSIDFIGDIISKA